MRMLVQWARSSPAGWEHCADAAVMASWSGAPVPSGGEMLAANDRRWINCINIQGNCARADHYHCRDTADGGCVLTQWDDDRDDWNPDDFVARVITLPELRPDAALGGAINTAGTQLIYAGSAALARILTPKKNGTVGNSNCEFRPWSEFVPPPAADTLHGIWLPDNLFALHLREQSVRSWREWCDHLPDVECEIVDGVRCLRDQTPQGRVRPRG